MFLMNQTAKVDVSVSMGRELVSIEFHASGNKKLVAQIMHGFKEAFSDMDNAAVEFSADRLIVVGPNSGSEDIASGMSHWLQKSGFTRTGEWSWSSGRKTRSFWL